MIQNFIQNNKNITYQFVISGEDLKNDECLTTTEWAEELGCTNDSASRLMELAGKTKRGKTNVTSRLAMSIVHLIGADNLE